MLEYNKREFIQKIAPFEIMRFGNVFYIILYTGGYKTDVFIEGGADNEGNGYDWESLAITFIKEKCSDICSDLEFDSEEDMFSVYSENFESLAEFVLKFREICDDRKFLLDLMLRTKWK